MSRSLADGGTVTLLADVGDVRRTLAQVRLALVVAAGLVLLAAATMVPVVVARALRPLDRITDVARSITSGDRARRLRPSSPDTELGRTAVAFDDMLDEVVGSEERLRRFLSDAAHELRTPLAGVQAAAEHLLRDDPPRDERERTVLGLVRQSRRAGRLVDDLLTMARIDSGLVMRPVPTDLRELADEVAAAVGLTGPGTEVRVEGPAAPLRADRDRLVQVVGNLVDNAVHAVGPGGHVLLRTRRGDGRVGLDVVDDGPGVPAADRERVFERLVRLDEARSTHRGGAGLGLAIARGIARAHGGDLTCRGRDDGRPGAVLRLDLPG